VLHLGDVVAGLAPMLRRLLGETIDLRTSIENRGHVLADPGQIEQVLINLAVNARDAMAEGGRLTLHTADITLGPDFVRSHPGAKPGPHVMVSVTDTGCGMDAATQKRIFEPFFTTKPKGKGTGLGLATVYGIVKQSGGGIWVTSRPGAGTTFTVYLPRVDGPVEDDASEPVEGPRGTETILLVEDEAVVRDFVQRLLSRHGYVVHAMATSTAAVAHVTGGAAPIHLVLTDVVMPELGGRAVADAVRTRHPEARVLYMSGYTDDAIVHAGILDDPATFLQKPFAAPQLLRKVRDVLDAGC
jgi:CheY-like chemotaxis protein